MSGSPIDPYALAKDCRKAYLRLRDAENEIKSLKNEVSMMIYLLDRLDARILRVEFDQYTKEFVANVINSCTETANDIHRKLARYSAQQNESKSSLGLWKRARWASSTTRDAKNQIQWNITILGHLLTQIETAFLSNKLDRLDYKLDRLDIKIDSLRSHLPTFPLAGINRTYAIPAARHPVLREIMEANDSNSTQKQIIVFAEPTRKQLVAQIAQGPPGTFRRMTDTVYGKAKAWNDERRLRLTKARSSGMMNPKRTETKSGKETEASIGKLRALGDQMHWRTNPTALRIVKKSKAVKVRTVQRSKAFKISIVKHAKSIRCTTAKRSKAIQDSTVLKSKALKTTAVTKSNALKVATVQRSQALKRSTGRKPKPLTTIAAKDSKSIRHSAGKTVNTALNKAKGIRYGIYERGATPNSTTADQA